PPALYQRRGARPARSARLCGGSLLVHQQPAVRAAARAAAARARAAVFGAPRLRPDTAIALDQYSAQLAARHRGSLAGQGRKLPGWPIDLGARAQTTCLGYELLCLKTSSINCPKARASGTCCGAWSKTASVAKKR